ncbi:alpha/beta hydrolase-fold protein [Vitiosangium sp. GDMCC 1.1324]|uniref:alpha/beta hydrolase-fold protein n=1 Tax=Vitiosangium sp. (strain GDMCC 1.1324) TaxID=2138576 RepID=UPI000D333A7F|nr:alpha/beta hydrolase-fold protein [Vitiosangium sp. GDMCC 1.1324]PTL77084.1 carbohydrate esterase [Vitiosangium sp. GDMCC 1.1324]
MTPRYSSRFTPLLLLALTTLAGCPKPPTTPPAGQTYSDVQFDVTVPPETPVDATLLLKGSDPAFNGISGQGLELVYQGDTTFSVKAKLPKDKELTYSIQMTPPGSQEAQKALDATGTKVPTRTVTVHENEETVSASVERWGVPTPTPPPQLAIIVAVPDITPPDATIWLSGNQPELGEWNGAGVKLYKAVNSSYATVLSFAARTSFEFKATRGSWDTVEKTAQGEEVDNHTHTTTGGFERLSFKVGSWADYNSVPPKQVLTGNIQYLRDVTPANPLLKKRDVIIWLPPDYEQNPDRRYPVLYMHDGQNLMDATTSFAGEWGVDETAQQLVLAGQVEPLIIVGVYNTSDRGPEYTQVPDPNYPEVDGEHGGRADEYGKFLAEELKPRIDSTYRTKPEALYTGLAGSSLGGLVSMYLGTKRSETFTRLGVVSPSVFWGEKDILSKVNALPGKLPLRIWVDIGTAESSGSQETVADTQALRDALVNKGWVLDTDLKYTEIEGAKHNEKAWAARFGDILKFLYPAP